MDGCRCSLCSLLTLRVPSRPPSPAMWICPKCVVAGRAPAPGPLGCCGSCGEDLRPGGDYFVEGVGNKYDVLREILYEYSEKIIPSLDLLVANRLNGYILPRCPSCILTWKGDLFTAAKDPWVCIHCNKYIEAGSEYLKKLPVTGSPTEILVVRRILTKMKNFTPLNLTQQLRRIVRPRNYGEIPSWAY